MFVTLSRLVLMACLLIPSLSWGLGLGEIHLNSALNEPMNAEIDLIAAGPDELNALRASLAPKDAFTRYGIDRPPFLVIADLQSRQEQGWPRRIAGAVDRFDSRTLCDVSGGSELGARAPDA